MTDTKNVSPVGWYVGSYLLRFIELEAANNDDPDAEFDCWENTVIVQANDLDEAYDKIVAIAADEARPYRGGEQGVPVQWVFEGVTDILPIYEPLRDGTEILWEEHDGIRLSQLRQWVRGRG